MIKIEICTINETLGKNQILGGKFNFWSKIKCWSKIEILVKNHNNSRK